MLGYDIEDIEIMLECIKQAQLYIPPAQTGISIGLNMTGNFLLGLIEEGHIQ